MTFADECLARADKATKGTWIIDTDEHGNFVQHSYSKAKCRFNDDDIDFIIHARTEVPELARRLQEACEELRNAASALNGYGTEISDPYSKIIMQLADELEAPLEKD